MIPGLILTLTVSLLRFQQDASRPLAAARKIIWLEAALTLSLVVGTSTGGQALNAAFQRSPLAANRNYIASIPKIPADTPYEKVFFQRGVNFTAEFPAVYASEKARTMLEKLPQYGINAVALVPFGSASRTPPQVRITPAEHSWESEEGIEQLSAVAHALGMKVFLKPHLGTEEGWRALSRFL